jgi:hypothetical protein
MVDLMIGSVSQAGIVFHRPSYDLIGALISAAQGAVGCLAYGLVLAVNVLGHDESSFGYLAGTNRGPGETREAGCRAADPSPARRQM